MPQEPDGYDLQRQVDRLREDLKAIVDRGESHVTESGLAALLARYDTQIEGQGKDIAEERAMRAVDITAEREQRKEAIKEVREDLGALERRIRTVTISVLLPVGLFLANLAFLIWSARS